MGSAKKYSAVACALSVTVMLLFVLPAGGFAGEDRPVPQIGGQNVPNVSHTIDFGKRYNVICTDLRQNQVYKNVRIVGFVSGEQHKSVVKGYGDAGRWLVLEMTDGRKVYLPGNTIGTLEEAEQPKR